MFFFLNDMFFLSDLFFFVTVGIIDISKVINCFDYQRETFVSENYANNNSHTAFYYYIFFTWLIVSPYLLNVFPC